MKRFLGYTSGVTWGRFHDDLKDIAKRLNKEPIEISLGKQDTLVAFFISSYRLNIPAGTITFNISPEFAPYLLQLKQNYTSYLLINIPNLRSGYSIRLHELLYQYYKIGKRYFELWDLQRKVGSNYKLYGDFKRKVILKAQKELKKHTNIAFAFHEKKNGRKVVGLEFIIFGNKPKRKNPNQLSLLEDAIEIAKDEETPAFSENIIDAMNDLGISEQNIAKYLAMGFEIVSDETKREAVTTRCETLQAYYLEKLELTRLSTDRENSAGYFIKALKEDWTNNKVAKKVKAVARTKERSSAKKQFSQLNQKIEILSAQKKSLKSPVIAELVANDEILEKAYHHVIEGMSKFMKEHIADIIHLPIRQQYEKTIGISSGVGVYLMEHYPDSFKQVANIDKQIKQLEQDVEVFKRKHSYLK